MSNSLLEGLMRAAKAFEGYHVTHYRLYRQTATQGVQTVHVEVLDAGEGSQHRYTIHARSEDGRTATGNPAADIDTALAIVHWSNLA